jgi:hypothetical protein
MVTFKIFIVCYVICVAYLYDIINSVFSCHCCPLAAQSSVLSSSDDPRFGYITNTYTSIQKKSVQVVSTILARLPYRKPIF